MARVVAVYDKNRRKDHRRPVRIEARLNGVPVTVVNISSGGVGLSGSEPDCDEEAGLDVIIDEPSSTLEDVKLQMGDTATLDLLLKEAPVISLQIEVVRFDVEESKIGGRFINVDSHTFDLIEKVVVGRLR